MHSSLPEITDAIHCYADQEVFERALSVYEEVFNGDYDLIVCIARRSYDLYKAFEPLIKERVGKNFRPERVTHNNMISAWWSAQGDAIDHKSVKVAVIDDVVNYGAALGKFLKDFLECFQVPPENISVFAFLELAPDGKDADIKKFFPSGITLSPGCLKCGDYRTLKSRSKALLRVIHATSTPYVAYMSAFKVPLGDAVGKIFVKEPSVGDDYDAGLIVPSITDKYSVYDITTHLLHESGIFAFCLFEKQRPGKIESDCLYPEAGGSAVGAERVSAIRCYVNPSLKTLLVTPYSTLFSCNASNVDIRGALPEALRKLCEISIEGRKPEEQLGYPLQLIAHRLLRYARSYIVGHKFLSGLGVRFESVTDGGLPNASKLAKDFHALLNRAADENKDDKPFERAWRFIQTNRVGLACSDKEERDFVKLLEYIGVKRGEGGGYVVDPNSGGLESARRLLGEVPDKNAEHKLRQALFKRVVSAFNELLENTDLNQPDRFSGLPWGVLYAALKELVKDSGKGCENGGTNEGGKDEAFAVREFTALAFCLCDFGCAITRVVCLNGVIGTAFCSGEGTCEARDISNHGFAWALAEAQYTDNGPKIGRIYSALAEGYAQAHPKTSLTGAEVRSAIERTNALIDAPSNITATAAMGEFALLAGRTIHITFFYALMRLYEEYYGLYGDTDNLGEFTRYVELVKDDNHLMWGRDETVAYILARNAQ